MLQENFNHFTWLAVISVIEEVSFQPASINNSGVADLMCWGKFVPDRGGRDDESAVAN